MSRVDFGPELTFRHVSYCAAIEARADVAEPFCNGRS